MMQGVPGYCQRCDDRDFLVGKFRREAVLFQNGIVTPSIRSVELCNNGFVVFHAHLINAIFVAVEREKPPVAAKAEAVDCRQNIVWLKLGISQLGFS